MTNNQYYNLIGQYYDKDACDYDARYWTNPVVQQMRQSFREEVKRYPAHTMLEIGFGTGMDLVHFAKTHPDRQLFGIDVSGEMLRISTDRIVQSGCSNIQVQAGSVEDLEKLYPRQRFDMIYVFFGALNTVENLSETAKSLMQVLNPNGTVVITFVNKWYLGGMVMELIRLRPARAFARLQNVWGGYSPVHRLPSRCYTPREVKAAFAGLKPITRQGYTIVHPAWFYTRINQKLGRLRRVLWAIDRLLNKTFVWRFGEYGLLVFQRE